MPGDSQEKAPQATPSPQPDIHVLVITHRFGVDITLHSREEDARIVLAAFVRKWWHESADVPGLASPPDDDDEAIGTYFEHQEDEGYTIAPVTIPAPGRAPAGRLARHQQGDQGHATAEPPHYTAGQVADALLNNPASTIDPGTVDMLIGEPATSDEPHRAVRELEMEDGTLYRLLIEQVRP